MASLLSRVSGWDCVFKSEQIWRPAFFQKSPIKLDLVDLRSLWVPLNAASPAWAPHSPDQNGRLKPFTRELLWRDSLLFFWNCHHADSHLLTAVADDLKHKQLFRHVVRVFFRCITGDARWQSKAAFYSLIENKSSCNYCFYIHDGSVDYSGFWLATSV